MSELRELVSAYGNARAGLALHNGEAQRASCDVRYSAVLDAEAALLARAEAAEALNVRLREALAETLDVATIYNPDRRPTSEEVAGMARAALALSPADALAEHDARVRAQEREACASECLVKVQREAGYRGQWEGYGGHMGDRTGPECAAAIRARSEGGAS